MPEKEKIRYCPNCGEIVDNKFCPRCGQENREYNATLSELLKEFFSHMFNLDSKFYHSLKHLIIHPGYLTQQYFKGKREKYTSPMRLYLIISMLYFLTFSVENFYDDVKNAVSFIEENKTELVSDSLNADLIEKALVDSENVFSVNVMNRDFDLNSEEVQNSFMNNVPRMMFFLFPISALILKLLYSRRKAHFFEHLIFLLHLHSFFFLTQIIGRILPFTAIELLIFITMLWYIIKAFLVYYKQKAGKTLFKIATFSFLYFIVLAVLLLVNLLLSSASLLA